MVSVVGSNDGAGAAALAAQSPAPNSGGETTVEVRGRNAFSMPFATLTQKPSARALPWATRFSGAIG